MNIEFIENGMELSQVREILNAVIQKVNEGQSTPISFNDLADRPCINGVELTKETATADLHLTLSQMNNTNEIENLVRSVGEQRAAETARNELSTKLDADFTSLPALKYNFNEQMIVTISDGNEIYKTKIHDLLLYIKYLIMQDSTLSKIASESTSDDPTNDKPLGDEKGADEPEPAEEEKPIGI